MPSIRSSPVCADDIERFLAERDDFAFEMKVFQTLQSAEILGERLQVDHGGHYVDSVTGKSRQFDLRAGMTKGLHHLRMSIECKHLSSSYPVLISRVPRPRKDAYHNLIVSKPRDVAATYEDRPLYHVARAAYGASPYLGETPVGKSVTQVGLSKNGREFVSGDAEIYEKWSQALASAEDLIWASIYDHDNRGRGEAKNFSRSVVLPLLVIPDGTLWVQDYSAEGSLLGVPAPVDACEFYLGKLFRKDSPFIRFELTHLHIFTFSGLSSFLAGVDGLTSLWPMLFPTFDGGGCLEITWPDQPRARVT